MTALALGVVMAAGATVPATALSAPTAVAPTTTVLASTVSSPQLSWAPPVLTDPITVDVSAGNRDLRLDPARDYVLRMPSHPVTALGGLIVSGGRNVVLIGGEISIPAGASSTNNANRGLYLKDQTGTVHVEGLLISGAGLGEGINLAQTRGAVVQLQNIRVDTVHGSATGHHADVLQTWAGPRQLRVDGLAGTTTYQGLFLLPKQTGSQPQPERFDLRRVDLRGTAGSGYMIWRDSLGWPMTLTDVHVSPARTSSRDLYLWPKGTGTGTEAWPSVLLGTPPQPIVPVGTAGTAYRSPGYATGAAPLVAPAVSMVTGARLTGGVHYTRNASTDLTWSAAGPAATHYDVLRDGAVVATVNAPTTRAVVPLVQGASTLTVRARAAGQPAVTSAPVTVVQDTTAPVITSGPTVLLRTGTMSSSGAAPLTVRWAASDAVRLRDVSITAPVSARYDAPRAEGYVNVEPGRRTWTLVAQDEAGNTRSVSTERTVTVVPEGSTQRTGTWTSVSDSRHHGGAAARATAAGARMKHTFTGSAVALTAHRSASSGRAEIWVDGTRVTTLDLAGTEAYRQVVWNRSWPTSGQHTVEVVVLGTSGRPAVTLDGFVVVG